jgi:hypothetical protein
LEDEFERSVKQLIYLRNILIFVIQVHLS